jgi:hypothetical protein
MARSGLGRLARIDVQAEVARRRRCFLWVESLLKPIPGLEPVFHSLPPLVAPYMYPFILYDSQAMERVGKVLAAHALECFPWPELPDVVAGQGDLPWFYKHTYGVSFLV